MNYKTEGLCFALKPTPDWSSGGAVPESGGLLSGALWNEAEAELRKAGWTKRDGPITNLNFIFYPVGI